MDPFAIYFPQFYPIETNDKAWGRGFTDWALVANANMRDLWPRRAPLRGFYDGSRPDVHLEQIEEARLAGIGGFGVYHYWFYTHQELGAFERTRLERADASTHPWFLIWASEGWSRRWLGDPAELVHLSSAPSSDAIDAHCDHLARCFESPGYFRIDGRPVFAWYHLAHFVDPARVVEQYRRRWQLLGFDVYTVQFIKKPFEAQLSALVSGSYLFEPRLYFSFSRPGKGRAAGQTRDLIARVFGERVVSRLLVVMDRLVARGVSYSAADFVRYLHSDTRRKLLATVHGEVQEVISPGWNNAPRYQERYTAVENLGVADFSGLLREAAFRSPLPPLVNAWNEWSEGAAIEPCAYLGRRYLDAIQALAEIGSDAEGAQHACAVSGGR